MLPTVIKSLHLVSLALWSGAVVFFSFFVALPTIDSMKRLAQSTGNWLKLTTEQQGTRLAGEFLDVVFSRYFPFQCICGLMALLTACWWWNTPGWLGKMRVILIALACSGAAVNYFVLAPHVHELRTQRYSEDKQVADAANAAFGKAHNYSLIIDMAGLLCVLIALILFVKVEDTVKKTSTVSSSATVQ